MVTRCTRTRGREGPRLGESEQRKQQGKAWDKRWRLPNVQHTSTTVSYHTGEVRKTGTRYDQEIQEVHCPSPQPSLHQRSLRLSSHSLVWCAPHLLHPLIAMVAVFFPRPFLALLSLLLLLLVLSPSYGQEISFQAVCTSAPWSPRAIGAFELIQKAVTYIDPSTGQSRTYGSATQPVYVMQALKPTLPSVRTTCGSAQVTSAQHTQHTQCPYQPSSPHLTPPVSPVLNACVSR
jgi:hypothetical protein